MSGIHPAVDKLLRALGFSPTQVSWRWRRLRQRLGAADKPAPPQGGRRRYKFCRHCGQVALDSYQTCPSCAKPLPSYLGSRLYRLFALSRVPFTYVTTGLVGTILALFTLMVGVAGIRGVLRPSGEALVTFGAFSTVLCQQGQVWRILTLALAHIGIIHLVFNAMAISQTLPAFEEEIGAWPTLTLVTLTQLGAVAAHWLWYDPRVLTAGASGVAFGVIGFGVAFFHRQGRLAERRFFVRWFWYGLIFGVVIGANNAAHVGGFLTGLPLGYLLARQRRGSFSERAFRAAGVLCLVAWLAALGFLLRSVVTHAAELRALAAG